MPHISPVRSVVYRLLIAAAVCFASLACDRTTERSATGDHHAETSADGPHHGAVPRPSKALDNAFARSITPLVNGGAYLAALSGGTWYLKDGLAERVGVIGTAADSEAFASSFDLDVTPLLNGGAYAFSLPGRGVWLLRGAHAWRVAEGVVPQQARDSVTGSPFYALYVHELQRRREIERDHEEEEDAKINEPTQDDPPDSP
jgi:hypothetical protein